MELIDNQREFPKSEFKNRVESPRLKELGNTDFLDCFLASYFKKFDLQKIYPELNEDPRVSTYYESLKKHLNLTNSNAHTAYENLLMEAESRGLDITMAIKCGAKMYDDETFMEWGNKMRITPTYIREVFDTNYPGASDISKSSEELDYPVQEVCRVLTDKGYLTYWSSANIKDFESRKGDVVLDKSVAYVLIDDHNLNTELKESLSLDGKCKFWGVAMKHSDDGKYYGIWSEITSPDMLCSDLSNSLVKKVSSLPNLSVSTVK